MRWGENSPLLLKVFNLKKTTIMGNKKKQEDNHAEQLNPNSDKYWKSRGMKERPEDWQEIVKQNEK